MDKIEEIKRVFELCPHHCIIETDIENYTDTIIRFVLNMMMDEHRRYLYICKDENTFSLFKKALDGWCSSHKDIIDYKNNREMRLNNGSYFRYLVHTPEHGCFACRVRGLGGIDIAIIDDMKYNEMPMEMKQSLYGSINSFIYSK